MVAVAEFNITVTHTTSGKEVVVAVEPDFTISSILEVLTESLQLKDRFVLASTDNKVLNPEATVAEAGLVEGSRLLLMPDPTGG
ncbi:MAG: hypothetical protein QW343_00245 [Candidatus Norongarragalinales archaeon]